MKNTDKLTKEFAAAVARIRNPDPEHGMTPLDARAKKDFTATSKKKFLKELNKRLKLFAAEMPHGINHNGLEDLIPLPAKVHFNKGALKVWGGRREAFDIDYEDLRKLKGMKQILKMAEKADTGISITMSNIRTAWPDRNLDQCTAPTPQERMPWTMKRDIGHFSELYITVKPGEKFDATKFPRKPGPKTP